MGGPLTAKNKKTFSFCLWLPCTLSCKSTVQRYVFPATFAIVDVIFPATFNSYNAFPPMKTYKAYIFTEGLRKGKIQPFSIFFENG